MSPVERRPNRKQTNARRLLPRHRFASSQKSLFNRKKTTKKFNMPEIQVGRVVPFRTFVDKSEIAKRTTNTVKSTKNFEFALSRLRSRINDSPFSQRKSSIVRSNKTPRAKAKGRVALQTIGIEKKLTINKINFKPFARTRPSVDECAR
jgi:hypothetical protein